VSDCSVCGNSPCDMHCGVCGTDVFDLEIETYTVSRWIPGSRHAKAGHNVLIVTLCVDCWKALPLP
jgi:hypothetical protein